MSPQPPDHELTIGDLAQKLGVSPRTVKNWEAKHWIPLARRNKWDHRVYNKKELDSVVTLVRRRKFFTNERQRRK